MAGSNSVNGRIAPVVEKAPYIAAGGTGVALWSLDRWALIISIAATLATFCINWYYKRKSFQALKDRMDSGSAPRREDIENNHAL
jgi:hypothetical protein